MSPRVQQSASSRKGLSPRTFRAAVYARLDNPFVSLFRLGIRLLQLIFALSAGISYALELSHGNSAPTIVYSQVVFGVTLLTLIIDAVTLRSYRLTFVIESILTILWLALFGVFYQIYVGDRILSPEYTGVNLGRMKRAVWVDLINFLLWLASAMFSTTMCCSGTKAMIREKVDTWRASRERKHGESTHEMEEGVIREMPQARSGDRLPLYEEIAALARND